MRSIAKNPEPYIWAAFIFLVIITWLVYSNLWMISAYFIVLGLLGVTNIILGVTVVLVSRFKTRAIILTTVGLAVGQWWLIEIILTQVLWQAKGFAP